MAITWNPSDKDAAITLSGGNLTASSTPPSTAVGAYNARATSAVGDGKWAFQVQYTSINDVGYDAIGLANASAPLNTNPGSSVDSVALYLYAYFYGNSALMANGAGATTWGGAVAGDTITFAWSKSGSTVLCWARVNSNDWNGDALADPATATRGFSVGGFLTGNLYAFFSVGRNSVGGTTTGIADFDGAFTLPSGFTYYDAASALSDAPLRPVWRDNHLLRR
jgi:hypothetical protein